MMDADNQIARREERSVRRRNRFASWCTIALLFCAAAFLHCHHVRAASPIVTFSQITSSGYATTDTNSCAVDVNNLVTATVGANTYQFAAFYNPSGEIMIGRRSPGSNTWTTLDSGINDGGSISDDHDVVAIAVDGNGKMHISWGMHNIPLNYSVSSASVMTSNLSSIAFASRASSVAGALGSTATDIVTYPQFYNIPGSGNLLFTYRDTNSSGGGSGNGDQYFAIYNAAGDTFSDTKVMQGQVPNSTLNFNAYLNRMQFSSTGNLVTTWTWRDSPDWQTNLNLMYAQSPDNGVTWYKLGGSTQYTLPIIQSGSGGLASQVGQVVWTLPENTSYINQGSMALDKNDRPIVATYWAPGTTGTTNATLAPNSTTNNPNRQYMLMYYDGSQWRTSQITTRTSDTAFDGPGGSSGQYVRDLGRPLVMVDQQNRVLVVGRSEDTSMGSYSNANLGLNKNNIVVYYNEDLMTGNTISSADWHTIALDSAQMGSYEPTYDSSLWNSSNMLNLFYEPTGLGSTTATVSVLQWNEQRYFAVAEPKKGDLNLDGRVTVADIAVMETALRDVNAFETQNGLTPSDLVDLGDANGDGVLNNADLQALLVRLANGGTGSIAAVPEPSALALVGSAIMIVLVTAGGYSLRCRRTPLGRVVSAGMPRMAPRDAANPFQRAQHRPVLLHRPNEIVAASRLEPALASNNRAERPLVDARQ
jgi:hypothetical protein